MIPGENYLVRIISTALLHVINGTHVRTDEEVSTIIRYQHALARETFF